jgi:hypothetical protein
MDLLAPKTPDLAQAHQREPHQLDHHDVNTTMIYTHVLNRGSAAVRSPADRMFGP